jgi:hypothetical protein
MSWREGKIGRLEILSKGGGKLRLANPFLGRADAVRVSEAGTGFGPAFLSGDFIEATLKPGARIALETKAERFDKRAV